MGLWYQKQDMNHKQILLVFIHTKTNIQENMISYESLIHHVCHNHQKWCVRISNSSLLSWSSEVICIQLTNTVLQSSKGTLTFINSLWPSVFIWRHRTGSTLSQEMPWCLMAPSHYLNHCWVSISDVLWHLLQDSFTWNYQDIYPWLKFTPPRGQSVKVWSCKTINVPRITWLVLAVVLQYPPPGSHRWPPVLCNDHLIFQSSGQPVHPHHGQYILEVIYPHLKAPARSPPPNTHTHSMGMLGVAAALDTAHGSWTLDSCAEPLLVAWFLWHSEANLSSSVESERLCINVMLELSLLFSERPALLCNDLNALMIGVNSTDVDASYVLMKSCMASTASLLLLKAGSDVRPVWDTIIFWHGLAGMFNSCHMPRIITVTTESNVLFLIMSHLVQLLSPTIKKLHTFICVCVLGGGGFSLRQAGGLRALWSFASANLSSLELLTWAAVRETWWVPYQQVWTVCRTQGGPKTH